MKIYDQCKSLKAGQQIARAITPTAKLYHYYVRENDVDKKILVLADRMEKPKRQESVPYTDLTDLLILSD